MGRVRRWSIDPSEDDEPDYRFTLANERTFLAWIRTSLGLLASGVAVSQLLERTDSATGRRVLSLLAVGVGVVVVVGAYLRWVAVQRAVRRGDPLPATRLVPFVAAGVGVLAVAAFVLVVAE